MDTTIRPYQDKDKSGVIDCIRVLKEVESKFDNDCLTTEESIHHLFSGMFDNVQQHTKAIFVAVDQDDQVMGFVSVEKTLKNEPEIVRQVEAVYVSDIAVKTEWQSQGIGTQLLEYVKQYARESNIHFLKLIVFADNHHARKLYERMGYNNYEITMLQEI